ncbi:hypothetical protein LCGC14_2697030, partial [marine sediment metagenome]
MSAQLFDPTRTSDIECAGGRDCGFADRRRIGFLCKSADSLRIGLC